MQPEVAAAAVQRAPASPGPARGRRRLTQVVGVLTIANVVNAAGGFITAPLTARALGAAGRGDLAAILAPLALVPGVLSLGLPSYAYRELPRGRRADEIIGSLAVPLLVVGLITCAVAVPIADLLAGSRETVRTFLIVGLLATPIVLLASLLLASLGALERWAGVVVANGIPFMVPLVAMVVLYVVGQLTVASAAVATIAGSVLAVVPGLVLLPGARRPVFRASIARKGIEFGMKAWLGGLALLGNLRLDQVLMITMVKPRVLGLYAIAASLSAASSVATSALAPPLAARVAGGHRELLPQAVRIMIATTIAFNALLALVTPTLLSVVFGAQFRGAASMTFILLGANVSFAGAQAISSGLQADGAPGIPSFGEGLALIVTVVGLVVLLPVLGGVGAALVSLAAYTTSLLFQVAMASRRLGVPVASFVVPTRADVHWAVGLLAGGYRRLRRGR